MTAPTLRPPPANAHLMSENGRMDPVWVAYFQGLGKSPLWVVGDYRQTAYSDLGPDWLKCNGTEPLIVDYPELAGILIPIMGGGVGIGTFLLPLVPDVINGGEIVAQTFIRAK